MNRPSGGMGEADARTLNTLLAELLELDEPERGARLAGLPPAQREALTSLLDAALEPDDFLQPGRALHPDLIEQAMATAGEALKPGAELGPYRVLHEIGAGGMGRVYLAERADGLFARQVAIKLLPPPDAGTDPERLQREQRLLACLRHPHIAQLYDAGISTKGAPYLVMEHVAGEPIDDFCRREALDARARLALVAQVCEAVQAAHQQLIVHRDIKPSNILVGPDSVVKLLDFGIARLVRDEPRINDSSGQSAGPVTQDRTLGQSALTPRYASPEQRAGATVGTASDIYQIGLLLWELLSGQRPREDAEPAPLPPLAGLPQEDLQAVIAKSLAAQPDARYATVDRLRDDLEHLLQGRPVSARPPTRSYVLRRFVARHRGGVAVGLLSVAAIMAGVAGTIWQAHRAETAGAAAQLEAQRTKAALARSEAMRSFLQDLFRATHPTRPRSEMPTLEQLLAEGARRAMDESERDAILRTEMLSAIGLVYVQRKRSEQAEPLVAAALPLAAAVREEAPLAWARVQLMAALHERDKERADEADRLLATIETHEGIGPAHTIHHEARFQRAWLKVRAFESAAALPSLIELRDALRDRDDAGSLRMRVASVLGVAMYDEDRWVEADQAYTELLPASAREHGEHHISHAMNLANAGGFAAEVGAFARAEKHLREAISLYDAIQPEPLYERSAARFMLGAALVNAGRYTEAEAQIRACWDERVALGLFAAAEDDPPFSLWMGTAALADHNYALATERFRNGLERYSASDTPARLGIDLRVALARAECAAGDSGSGQQRLTSLQHELEGLDTPVDAQLRAVLDVAQAHCLHAQGESEAALAQLRDGAGLLDSLRGGAGPKLADRDLFEAEVLISLNRVGEATEVAERGRQRLLALDLSEHPLLERLGAVGR